MSHQIIHTDKAPAAVGPYSQAIRVGNLVYTAGQIGLDPSSGTLKEGLEAQTHQVLSNLQAVLEAAGASLSTVMKTTIYLVDMSDFAQVNQIYGAYFSDAPPARSTVAVASLPLGALVEIEAVAYVNTA